MKLKIKVHTNSSQEKINNGGDNNYEVWIKKKPIENKANVYIEKLLKKYFKKEVKVIKGMKSKNKVVEIK